MRYLFVDRDGTLINEYPPLYQIDSLEKVSFYPGALTYMRKIVELGGFEIVLVSNQDGLDTPKFTRQQFEVPHKHVIDTFAGEGVHFKEELIDKSYPHEGLATRKPGTGMFGAYLNNEDVDMAGSYVIGDRITDVQLAKNLGCKAIWINNNPDLGGTEVGDSLEVLRQSVALETTSWKEIYEFLALPVRTIAHERNTAETRVKIELELDGTGKNDIQTGLPFFDHMLDQIGRHGGLNLSVRTEGDLHIDEHHTIEDTGIALGAAFGKAIGDKHGMQRYGFALPMDDCAAEVLIDFGGRAWCVWNLRFSRERIGDVPTEMFYHFFKSFSDAARCNLHVKATGENEHHLIESVFKAFARAVRMALKREAGDLALPSTKGML